MPSSPPPGSKTGHDQTGTDVNDAEAQQLLRLAGPDAAALALGAGPAW
jgi:hypothetical protein